MSNPAIIRESALTVTTIMFLLVPAWYLLAVYFTLYTYLVCSANTGGNLRG